MLRDDAAFVPVKLLGCRGVLPMPGLGRSADPPSEGRAKRSVVSAYVTADEEMAEDVEIPSGWLWHCGENIIAGAVTGAAVGGPYLWGDATTIGSDYVTHCHRLEKEATVLRCTKLLEIDPGETGEFVHYENVVVAL